MLNNEISNKQKVNLFNNFLKSLELNENPDVIIIGIPGGIIQFNQHIINDFGILTYIISQAVSPDIVVLNNFANDSFLNLYENISSICNNRFNFNLDYCCLANKILVDDKLINMELNKILDICSLDKKFVDDIISNYLKDNGIRLYNSINQNDLYELTYDIIKSIS